MTLPVQLQYVGERPHGRDPWIWMWELELAKRTVALPPVVFRMTSADRTVPWPPRAATTASMTVTTYAVPTRGRFTAATSTFTGWVAGDLVDVAGSALGSLGSGGNNTTQAVVYAVASNGSYVELLGAFVAEGPRSFSLTVGPTPVTYYPFPFLMGEIEQTQEGDLPSLELNVDNTARTLMSVLHDGGGFQGNRATLVLTHTGSLASPPYPNHQFFTYRFTIASAAATNSAVQLRLESPSFFQQRVPRDRFLGKRCRWLFGSRECGYPITPFSAFTTCNKDLADCIERGEDEVARFLPRLHPRRFGGFPGIPQQRAPR